MIRRCLIIDTETTGLVSDEQAACIEVGAILYSVQNRISLVQYSSIIPLWESTVNPMAEVNRISDSALLEMRECYDDDVHAQVEWMKARADVIVAHNADFDRAFLKQAGWDWGRDTRWVCTAEDFTWSRSHARSRDRLTQVAIAYDVPVVWTHRALDDCRLIAELFNRVEDLQEMFEKAMLPRSWYIANVSYDARQLAKDAGFQWNEPFERKWSKRLTAEEAAGLAFPVIRVLGDEGELL